MKTSDKTVHSIVCQLQEYWSGKGCMLSRGESLPMGAAAFHPAAGSLS